jgi:AcrR family transcriptional regulator
MRHDVLKPPNKNEVRTRETRELLLHAAETIFVRDGYEGAELGEIAALAGRTKGAIYAHFRSKEELFLALFIERMALHANRMYELLAESTSLEQNLDIFREFYLGTLEDKNWALLLLEFKLFAIRHPESKERLMQAHRALLPRAHDEGEYAKVFGSAGEGQAALSRSAAVAAFGPILSALAVEAQFEPALLDEHTLRKVVTRLFDALLPRLRNDG